MGLAERWAAKAKVPGAVTQSGGLLSRWAARAAEESAGAQAAPTRPEAGTSIPSPAETAPQRFLPSPLTVPQGAASKLTMPPILQAPAATANTKVAPKLILPVLGFGETLVRAPGQAEAAAETAAKLIGKVVAPTSRNAGLSMAAETEQQKNNLAFAQRVANARIPVVEAMPANIGPQRKTVSEVGEEGISAVHGIVGTPDMTKKTDKALYGAGQFAASMLMSLAPGGVAPTAVTAAGQAAADAKAAGASEDEQIANALVVGAVTAFGFSKAANSVTSALQKRLITPGIASAAFRRLGALAENGAVNVAQDLAENATAKATYDPDRKVMDADRLGGAFTSGVLGGALFHLPGFAGDVKEGVSFAREQKAIEQGMVRTPEAVPESHQGTLSTADTGAHPTFNAVENYVKNAWEWTPGKPKQESKQKVAPLSAEVVSAVAQITKQNVEGYHIALVDNDIRHIRNSHGPDTKEGYPVGPEDFLRVPEIINNFDRVYSAKPVSSTGETTIRFEKRYNGKTYLLTAISDVDGTLGVKQMIKVPTDSVPKFVKNATEMVPRVGVPSEDVSRNYAQSAQNHFPDSITPPKPVDVNAPAEPAAQAADGATLWTPDEISQMAAGERPLPEDYETLDALAEQVTDMREQSRNDINLQYFAGEVERAVSKAFTNTYSRNGLDKEFPEIYNADVFGYDRLTERMQLADARRRIAADPEAEYRKVTSLDGDEMTLEDTNVAFEMMKTELDKLRANPGDRQQLIRVRNLAKAAQESGTKAGQTVQAFAKYNRKTAEGVLAFANRLIAKLPDELPQGKKEDFTREKKVLDEAGKRIEDEAEKNLIEAIEQIGLEGWLPGAAGVERVAAGPAVRDGAGSGKTAELGARDAKDLSFADQLARKISEYAEVKEKKPAPGPDPIDDMLNELLRIAKESPIADVNKAARKARDPVQFAMQALDAWGRYSQVYEDAKEVLRAKYRGKPEMLARLDDFFGSGTRPPISNETMASVIRNGLNDVGLRMPDILPDSKTRKDFINHVIQQAGLRGEPAYFMRNFMNERLDAIRVEYSRQSSGKSPGSRYRLLRSLYDTNLKREFVPEQLVPALKDYVTGLDTPKRATQDTGRISIRDIARDYYSTGKKQQKGIVDAIVKRTGLTGADAENLRSQLHNKLTEFRKEAARKEVSKLTAEKRISVKDPAAFGKKLAELANEGVLTNSAMEDVLREKFGLPVLTNDDVTYILQAMDRYQALPDGAAKEAQYDAILKHMANKLPKSAMEQWRAIRRTAMLASGRTHLSNIAGNAVNYKMQQAADLLATAIEKTIPKDMRTKAILTAKDKPLLDLARADFERNKRDLLEGSNRYDVKASADGLRRYADTFKGDKLNKITGLVGDVLTTEDLWFYRPAYAEGMAQFMKARGLTEITPEAREYAKSRAEDVTLRRIGKLSTFLNGLKRDDGAAGVVGTMVDIEVPFVNTPINVLRRGIEYSPANAVPILVKALRKSAPKSELIELTSKMMIGSIGATGVGFALQALGAIDMDDDEGLLMKTPWGGKYTIDWLQPFAMSMAMGAAAFKSAQKKGFTLDAIVDAVAAGGDTIFNMSVLQSVKKLLGGDYGGPTETMLNAPADAALQMIPALSGQIARTIDPTVRSTYDPNELVAFGKRAMAKTPGLSFLLPAKIDAMGQEMKQGGAISQFLVPGRTVWQPQGEAAEEARRVQDALRMSDPEAARSAQLKPASPRFSRNNKDFELTAREFEEFSRELGGTRKAAIEAATRAQGYAGMSDEQKAEAIRKAISRADGLVKTRWAATHEPKN